MAFLTFTKAHNIQNGLSGSSKLGLLSYIADHPDVISTIRFLKQKPSDYNTTHTHIGLLLLLM